MSARAALALADRNEVPPLLLLCVQKLAQILVKYGSKKIRLARVSALPQRALDALLEHLLKKNALNDNLLPHVLTRHTRILGLEGAVQLRRCVLNTIGWSCPNLRVLDVRSCQQVDNRIVRDVLQYCERLECLRLDGCTRISDSAFAPSLWKAPLAGLLGLRELTVGKCGQITSEGLMGFVVKGAPFLTTLGLEYCRLAITDDVAGELLYGFGLQVLDVAFCTQLSDAAFKQAPSAGSAPQVRELRLAGTPLSDAALEALAPRASALEVVDAGWVEKLSDQSVTALVNHCGHLRVLCVCNTQITDEAFRAIARCRHLERLDASWCLRASPRALELLTTGPHGGTGAVATLPLKELVLDYLGALNLGGDLSLPPASPGLWDASQYGRAKSSPASPGRKLSLRFPPEPPSLALPPAAVADDGLGVPLQAVAEPVDPATGPVALLGAGSAIKEALASLDTSALAAATARRSAAAAAAATAAAAPKLSPLERFAAAFVGIECLFLDGVRDVATVSALKALAASCPRLREVALILPARDAAASAVVSSGQSVCLGAGTNTGACGGTDAVTGKPVRAGDVHGVSAGADSDAVGINGNAGGGIAVGEDETLRQALLAVASGCPLVTHLRLDCSLRPHKPVVAALAMPSFSQLRSLTLVCFAKGGGLHDSELETILKGRSTLETIALRNCEGISESLFPRWCNRAEREAEVHVELEQALFASFGCGSGLLPAAGAAAAPASAAAPERAASSSAAPPPVARSVRRRHFPRCAAATALRSVTSFSMAGATALSDRAADSLAELLHDAQSVELRGSPFLAEDSLRSFRKGCRFIRSAIIVTRDRTLSWTASTSSVKKHHPRKSKLGTSGSSGTESG
eukprot:TRINITY_DN14316_c0_g4_i1.p1 TRINITY_DN14316_c0_g4~~TRINITY_DN14316_c0_g4_i1.p1  ORF type:complete len:865 (+),score=184.43 TRINITY_DN14316_c0_g4_i1:193-2787(+)